MTVRNIKSVTTSQTWLSERYQSKIQDMHRSYGNGSTLNAGHPASVANAASDHSTEMGWLSPWSLDGVSGKDGCPDPSARGESHDHGDAGILLIS